MPDLAQLGIAVDTSGVKAGISSLKDLKSVGESTEKTLEKTSKSFKNVGAKLSIGLTAPIAGLGATAIKMAVDFNASMAQIGTLIPGNTKRVNELKGSVQDIAIATGKSSKDIAGGLFQVISAFGDSAEAAEVLRINAVAAAGGLSTTTDAINLTSAVTKAYGDTSAEAVRKVTDLAFQTNKLGQTTFPELAGALGRVTPLAKALGVTQEELFGAMATLTGVTGNTNEVSTQLRATYQALLKPTAEMAGALSNIVRPMIEMGTISGPLVDEFRSLQNEITANYQAMEQLDLTTKEGLKTYKNLEKSNKDLAKDLNEVAGGLGSALVEAEGFQGALGLVAEQADGNSLTLGKMFGSVESINAVLALTGEQAENLTNKTNAMSEANGAASQAFKDMSDGVNKSGFTFQQLQEKFSVVTTKLGEGLIPIFVILLDTIEPVVDFALRMADAFKNLDPFTQKIIVGMTAFAAAIGPVLATIGLLLPLLPAIGAAFAALVSPIGLAIAAVAGVAVIVANWEKVKTEVVRIVSTLVTEIKTWLVDKFESLVIAPIKQKVESVTGFFADMYDKVVGNSYVPDMVEIIGEEFSTLDRQMVNPTQRATDAVNASFKNMLDTTKNALNQMLTGVLRGTQSMKDAFKNLGENLVLSFSTQAINDSIDGLFARVTQGAQVAANVNGASRGQGLGTAIAGRTGTTGIPSGGSTAVALGGTAIGGGLAGFGIGSLGSAGFGSLNAGGSAESFGQKGAIAGGIVGGIVGSLIPGLGTALGAVAGTVLGGTLGTTIGGVVEKRTRENTLIGAAIGTAILPGLGTILGGAIGALLTGKGKKPEITAATTAGAQGNAIEGAFGFVSTRGSRGGAAGETVLRDSLLQVDNALADYLTSAQVEIVKQTLISKKTFNEKSRDVGDAVSEVIQERLRLEVEAIGKSFGLSGNLGNTLLTGSKFSEEQLQGVFDAINFIKNFDDANKNLSRGLADVTATARTTAQQLAGETLAQIVAFKEETKRLGLPIQQAEASTKAFVEIMIGLRDAAQPLTEVQQALATVRSTFEELGPVLREVGITAEQAAEGLNRSLAKIRDDFSQEIQRQITSFQSPIENTIRDLIAVQGARIDDGTAVGAKLHPVWLLMLEEFKAIAKDLDPSQAGPARASIIAGLQSLGRFNEAYINQAVTAFDNSLSQVGETAGQTVDELSRLKESLRDFRESLLLGQFSTLSPEQKFLQAQQTFNSTASLALSGNLDAIKKLQDVSTSFLSANQDFNASSNPQAFQRVLAVLDQVAGVGLSPQQQLNATAQNIDLLQSQLTQEQQNFDAQVESLDSLGRLIAGQQEQTAILQETLTTTKDGVRAIDVQTDALVELLQASIQNAKVSTRVLQQQAGTQ